MNCNDRFKDHVFSIILAIIDGCYMLDIKIGSETYGLILISANVSDFLVEKDRATKKSISDELIDNFLKEDGAGGVKKENIEYINSWPLLGIHDLAILVKSSSKLDNAIIDIGKSLNAIKNRKIKRPMWMDGNNKICEIYNRLIDRHPEKDKTIEIFDFWCEPLIPLFISDKINDKKNNCLIAYLRLNTSTSDYADLLTLFDKKCIDFSGSEVLAMFNGFGAFDLVLFIKYETYSNISQLMYEMRSNLKIFLYESCSLLCCPTTNIIAGNDMKMPFSILMKVSPWADDPIIWKDIVLIAKLIGISRVCIEGINSPMNLTYKQGSFTVVFIGHGDIVKFTKLHRLLESLPFIIDTSTILNSMDV